MLNWKQRYAKKITTTYGDTIDYPSSRLSQVANPIVKRLTSKVKRGNKTLYIIAGAPGSGKTFHRKNRTYNTPDENSSVHIDADEIKYFIPEARDLIAKGDLEWASKVHEESRIIADLVLQKSLKNSKDIVYDSTGQFTNNLGTLRAAKKRGYRIISHYNVAPQSILESNRIERQRTDLRKYPGSQIKSVMNYNYNIIPQVANYSDEFYLWDTSSKNEKRLLAHKKNGELKIYHPDAYKYADFK